MTTRRNMLNEARDRNAKKVAAAILPIFQKQYRRLQRVIRKGGNLRKAMGKIDVPEIEQAVIPPDEQLAVVWPKVEGAIAYKVYQQEDIDRDAFYRAAVLLKIDPPPAFKSPPPQPKDDSWDAWKAALIIALLAALGDSADDIGGVESDVWESRGYAPLQFDPDQAVQDYQSRIGRNISNIADDTLTGVQAAIAAWYTSGAPFSDLVDDLEKWFDADRAGLIGRTEVGNLTSQITLEAMKFYGFTDWIWDAMGENPCSSELIIDGNSYEGCQELNGMKFPAGASMPPDAAHPNCQCRATPIVPDGEKA